MTRILCALGMAMSLATCGNAVPTGPELSKTDKGVCAVERLACFSFSGTLSVDGGDEIKVEGWSEDLPTPGYANRWHYLLSAPAGKLLAAYSGPTQAHVYGAAVVWPNGRGGMTQEATHALTGARIWRIGMRPTSDSVAAQFAGLAGANESRLQTFEVNQLSDGGAEILITELAR